VATESPGPVLQRGVEQFLTTYPFPHVPSQSERQDREHVQQFAWYYKKEIAKERAKFYADLRRRCDGRKQHRVDVLTQIIEEANEHIAELAEVCNRLDLRFIEDQAVWNNYNKAFCRYRELQADVVRQLAEDLDPHIRRSWQEDVVDVDQLFDPVCPCKEPISVE
jgi:hypothetical protein